MFNKRLYWTCKKHQTIHNDQCLIRQIVNAETAKKYMYINDILYTTTTTYDHCVGDWRDKSRMLTDLLYLEVEIEYVNG